MGKNSANPCTMPTMIASQILITNAQSSQILRQGKYESERLKEFKSKK